MRRIIAALVLMAVWVGTANAIDDPVHPPDAKMAWLMDQAADYWRSQGAIVPDYVVSGEPVTTPRAYAEVQPPWAGEIAHVRIGKPMLVADRWDNAHTALHEMVHVMQTARWITDNPRDWVEAQADVLADDNVCPFMARLWGRRVALRECNWTTSMQTRAKIELLMVSAQETGQPWRSVEARRWRLHTLPMQAGR